MSIAAREDLHPGLAQYAAAPKSGNFNHLRKRLLAGVEGCLQDYHMRPQEVGQRWLVCLSGGKDSYALLSVLLELQALGRLDAELIACNLDQGQPGFPEHVLPDYLTKLGVDFHIERRDTYSVVTEKIPEHKTYCSLCSRLRRGILYDLARKMDCSAIVLGHHRDDALETFMMNLLYGGRLAAMPAKLRNDEDDLYVLRPLITASEDDIARFARAMDYPIIPCTLCGSQDGLQREAIKARLSEWETRRPGTRDRMFKALTSVNAGHLLDPALFDFSAI